MNEDEVELILKQCYSFFVTYEIPPGIHTMKDFSEVVYTNGDHENILQIQQDDISMKTKPVLSRFGGNFGTLRFHEKTFFKSFFRFHTILGL